MSDDEELVMPWHVVLAKASRWLHPMRPDDVRMWLVVRFSVQCVWRCARRWLLHWHWVVRSCQASRARHSQMIRLGRLEGGRVFLLRGFLGRPDMEYWRVLAECVMFGWRQRVTRYEHRTSLTNTY